MRDYNYISIPKTASQSINKILEIKDLGANNHHAVHKLPPAKFSFTFLREPISRLISWHSWHKVAMPKFYNTSLEDWIIMGCPHHWQEALLQQCGITNPLNQYEFVMFENEIAVDFIGDYSKLQDHFNIVCDTLKIERKILPLVGNTIKDDTYISKRSRKLLETKFKKDFILYDLLLTKSRR